MKKIINKDYFPLYRLTNLKTGQVFEDRMLSNVVVLAGLNPSYKAAMLRKTKKWLLETIAPPNRVDKAAYRRELYDRTRSRYPEYEKRKRQKDPLFETRKRLSRKGWKNPDGTPFTAEQHRTLLKEACSACQRTTDTVADHCHTTNIVRGPLCRTCNLALGYVQDNTELLYSLIKYLEERKY